MCVSLEFEVILTNCETEKEIKGRGNTITPEAGVGVRRLALELQQSSRKSCLSGLLAGRLWTYEHLLGPCWTSGVLGWRVMILTLQVRRSYEITLNRLIDLITVGR